MSEAIGAGKVSAKGSFNLFLGVAISSVILAVGTVIIGSSAFLGAEKYDIYSRALMPLSLFILFRDFGINSAMIKYVAQYRSENRMSEIRSILVSGMLFELLSGMFFSVVCYSLAGFLAVAYDRPEIKSLIEIMAITILMGSLITVAQSAFTGFERMEFYSLTLLFQSAIRTILVIFLVFVGYSTLGAVLGYTVGFVATGVLAALFFILFFHRSSKKGSNGGLELSRSLRFMLKYGLPLYIASIVSGFLAAFLNFITPIYCTGDPSLIGNYQMAVNFGVIITFFTVPIGTVLFPAFSKLRSEKEMETLKNVFRSSIKYTALIVIPVTTAIMVLSKPFVFALLPNYSSAPLFLTLYVISFLYTGFGSLSLGSFLNGQGKTVITMFLNLISVAVGVPLGLLLIPTFKVVGLIVTTLIAGLPSLIIGLNWAKKHFGVSVDWISSAKIFLASGIAGAIAYVVVSVVSYSAWIELAAGGIVFLFVYLIAILLNRAIDKNDIDNLREMLSELGPIFYLIKPLLKLVEKLLAVFSFSSAD